MSPKTVLRALVLAPLLVLALGTGTGASASISNTTVPFAGLGAGAYGGDGGPALGAYFNSPRGLAWLADGSMLVADSANNRIRRIWPSGMIQTVVGNGLASSVGDGGLAVYATINNPRDVETAPDGLSYYISESSHRIRKVDASGIITRVAGTGTAGFSGDLGAAGSAQLNAPQGMGVASNGDLYIADYSNQRIRRVLADPSGSVTASSTIQSVAGTGTAGFTGDLGPATSAQLNNAYDVLPMTGGRVLIADYSNGRVREVDGFGVIRTVVGGFGCAGTWLCGDGGPATAAGLGQPITLTSDRAGGYLIVDYNNSRVRRVTADGTISTIFGSGVACGGYDACGNGGPAENAALANPQAALVAADGAVYVSDLTHRIRARVTDAPYTGATGASGASGAGGSTGAAGAAGTAGATGAAGQDGGTGARGSNGGAGAVGDPGTNGGPGNPGVAGTSTPTFVSFIRSGIMARRGTKARVDVFTSRAAKVVVRISLRGKNVRTVRRDVDAGRLNLSVGGLKAGRYRASVAADGGGSRAVDRTSLTVRSGS